MFTDTKSLLSDLEPLDGLEMTKTLETKEGYKYRVVRRSKSRASIIVQGAEELDFEVVSDGEGGFQTMEKGIIDTLVDWGGAALKLGKKLLAGECKITNTQTATMDPATGNMTGFTNTTTLTCSPS